MEKIQKIFIKPDRNINAALKQIDESAEKILVVVGPHDQLIGTLTDGDIRRWILKGGSLQVPVSRVMNRTPRCLREGYTADEAKKLMVTNKIECLPVVNKAGVVISAIRWVELFETRFTKHSTIDAPVVIMAGGEGTRLAPFTKVLPKPLLPVGEQPIITLIIDKFVEFGCEKFYLSLNYKASIIKAYFHDLHPKYHLEYIYEEEPRGTAGSLQMMKKTLKTSFFVSNCDILINADYADILHFHQTRGNAITLVGSVKHYVIPYGVCEIGAKGVLKKIQEKPEQDLLVNTGLYILEPEVLKDIPVRGVYHITDLISKYLRRNKKVGVYPVSEKSWLDMGQWEALQDMVKRLGV